MAKAAKLKQPKSAAQKSVKILPGAEFRERSEALIPFPNRFTKFLDAYNASIPNYTTGVRYTDRLSKPPRVPPPR